MCKRKHVTVVNEVSSDEEPIDYGVPQGSLLVPTCFKVDLDDMPDKVGSQTNLFADDTTGFETDSTVDGVIPKL